MATQGKKAAVEAAVADQGEVAAQMPGEVEASAEPVEVDWQRQLAEQLLERAAWTGCAWSVRMGCWPG
jgi:hypothetical protein